MRLFEVEDRFVNDLTMVLRNLVGRSNEKRAPQRLSYPALDSLLSNMGYGGIDANAFGEIYEKNDDIQRIVASYNEEGIVLKTKTQDLSAPATSGAAKGPSIDAMAKQGVNDYQSKLS